MRTVTPALALSHSQKVYKKYFSFSNVDYSCQGTVWVSDFECLAGVFSVALFIRADQVMMVQRYCDWQILHFERKSSCIFYLYMRLGVVKKKEKGPFLSFSLPPNASYPEWFPRSKYNFVLNCIYIFSRNLCHDFFNGAGQTSNVSWSWSRCFMIATDILQLSNSRCVTCKRFITQLLAA